MTFIERAVTRLIKILFLSIAITMTILIGTSFYYGQPFDGLLFCIPAVYAYWLVYDVWKRKTI
jgi:hypothetical protein